MLRTPLFSMTLIAISALPAVAQSNLRSAPSGRATTEVTLSPPRVQGQPAGKASKIRIDYGQPHARGRTIVGATAGDLGKVWRLGANEATSLTSDVDLAFGATTIPKGSYTLFTETSATGEWKLIVNKKTGEWGTEYDASSDLAKINLKSRTLATPIESLTIWLIPGADGARSGELRFAWGTREFSAPWTVK